MKARPNRPVSLAVLAGLGGLSVARLLVTISVMGMCVRPIPLVAPAGLHLDLLIPSGGCPHGSFLLGAGVHQFADLLVVVSATVLAVALVNVLVALGLGLWLHRLVAEARGWLLQRLVPRRPVLIVCPAQPRAWWAPTPHLVGFGVVVPRLRRGPPAGRALTR